MKTKKKAAQTSDKQPQNKLKSIKTSDGKEYKIIDSLLMKHSLLLKSLIEDEKDDEVINLTQIDSDAFEEINTFMQAHKQKDAAKIELPLKSNHDLKFVMEHMDATQIEEIMKKGDQYLLKIFNAAYFLQMDDFKKRLVAGLATKLMKSTLDELKIEYGLQKDHLPDEQIRQQTQKRLKFLLQLREEG